MAAPTLTVTGQELYDSIAPLMTSDTPGYSDADNGYAGAILCGAIATMVDPVSILVRDQADGTPGWAILFQPDNAAYADGLLSEDWLTWVAQFAGDSASVAAASTLAAKQSLVANPINFNRGRNSGIETAINLAISQSTALSALGTYVLSLSWASPFVLTIAITYPTGTSIPATAASYILANIQNALAAWVVVSVVVAAGANYAELNAAHSTYTALDAAHATYGDMLINPTA